MIKENLRKFNEECAFVKQEFKEKGAESLLHGRSFKFIQKSFLVVAAVYLVGYVTGSFVGNLLNLF